MASKRGPRLVLALSVLAGLANTVLFPLRNPQQVALASDVYYYAARAALAGADVYAVNPIGETGFRYPPVVVLAFYPHGLLGDPALAYALQTLLNIAALAGILALTLWVVDHAGVELDRLDVGLVSAFVFLVGPVGLNLVMGQVNLVLAFGIAAGAVLVLRGRERAAGAAFGFVALVKLFPALVGAWLLRQRAWGAIAAATVTGVLGLVAGVLVFGPATTGTYVTDTLSHEASVGSFAGGPDPTASFVTVRRQLTAVFPGLPADWLLPASAVVMAPVFVGVNRVVDSLRSRLVALQGTLLAALAMFPLEPFYVVLAFFPLVPLLYLLDAGRDRRLFLTGAVLLAIPVTWESVLTAAVLLPDGAESVVRNVAGAAFGFVLPPTVGTWLVLAACLLFQHRAARDAGDAG
jgi:hypothetical protein